MITGRLFRAAGTAALLILGACGAKANVPPMSPQAQTVEVKKADAPPGATLIGPIEASHGSGCGIYGRQGTFEGAMNALREEAAKKGADYVALITATEPHSERGCFDQEFKLRGLASTSAAPATASTTPPSPAPVGASPVAATVTAPGAAPVPAAPKPTPACTPGTTQACVGPGACQGGQFCLPDGMGFSPCDCGSKS
jgi:hypothetical protein